MEDFTGEKGQKFQKFRPKPGRCPQMHMCRVNGTQSAAIPATSQPSSSCYCSPAHFRAKSSRLLSHHQTCLCAGVFWGSQSAVGL